MLQLRKEAILQYFVLFLILLFVYLYLVLHYND